MRLKGNFDEDDPNSITHANFYYINTPNIIVKLYVSAFNASLHWLDYYYLKNYKKFVNSKLSLLYNHQCFFLRLFFNEFTLFSSYRFKLKDKPYIIFFTEFALGFTLGYMNKSTFNTLPIYERLYLIWKPIRSIYFSYVTGFTWASYFTINSFIPLCDQSTTLSLKFLSSFLSSHVGVIFLQLTFIRQSISSGVNPLLRKNIIINLKNFVYNLRLCQSYIFMNTIGLFTFDTLNLI